MILALIIELFQVHVVQKYVSQNDRLNLIFVCMCRWTDVCTVQWHSYEFPIGGAKLFMNRQVTNKIERSKQSEQSVLTGGVQGSWVLAPLNAIGGLILAILLEHT